MYRCSWYALVLCALMLGSAPLRSAQEIQFEPSAKAALQALGTGDFLPIPLGGWAAAAPGLRGVLIRPATPTIASAPKCASIPATHQVQRYNDNAYLLDRDVAANLKITFLGTGNAAWDQSSKVFLRELTKFATCPATDGSGELLYGAILRAAVLIDATDASAGLSFAVVAASATLKARTVQVRVESAGYSDGSLPSLTSTAQNVTSGGLTVENYGDFRKALNSAFDAAAKSTVSSMQLVGFVSSATSDLGLNLATIYALDRIAQGYGCLDAVKMFGKTFSQSSSAVEQAIRNTYDRIAHGCDASSTEVRAAADTYLKGQRLKK